MSKNKKQFVGFIALATLVTIEVVNPAYATPILEFSGVSVATIQPNVSVGWSFTTIKAIIVNALDAYDPTGAGAGQVRLYNGSGSVLASAIVTSSDPLEGTPRAFHSHAIAPISLAAHTTYYVAEDVAAGATNVYVQVTGLTTDPSITYGGGVLSAGFGSDPTVDNFPGTYSPAYFGPNFDIAVPEPASLVLLGASLLGLAAFRRRAAA